MKKKKFERKMAKYADTVKELQKEWHRLLDLRKETELSIEEVQQKIEDAKKAHKLYYELNSPIVK